MYFKVENFLKSGEDIDIIGNTPKKSRNCSLLNIAEENIIQDDKDKIIYEQKDIISDLNNIIDQKDKIIDQLRNENNEMKNFFRVEKTGCITRLGCNFDFSLSDLS